MIPVRSGKWAFSFAVSGKRNTVSVFTSLRQERRYSFSSPFYTSTAMRRHSKTMSRQLTSLAASFTRKATSGSLRALSSDATSLPPELAAISPKWADLHEMSVKNPDKFFGSLAKSRLRWRSPFSEVRKVDHHRGDIQWFLGGQLNVSGMLRVYMLQAYKTHGHNMEVVGKRKRFIGQAGGRGGCLGVAVCTCTTGCRISMCVRYENYLSTHSSHVFWAHSIAYDTCSNVDQVGEKWQLQKRKNQEKERKE